MGILMHTVQLHFSKSSLLPHSRQCTQTGSPMQPQYRLYGLAPWTCKYFSQDLVMAPWGWIPVWSETCRGERILHDFNVLCNKYVHELVTIDTGTTTCFGPIYWTSSGCTLTYRATIQHVWGIMGVWGVRGTRSRYYSRNTRYSSGMTLDYL